MIPLCSIWDEPAASGNLFWYLFRSQQIGFTPSAVGWISGTTLSPRWCCCHGESRRWRKTRGVRRRRGPPFCLGLPNPGGGLSEKPSGALTVIRKHLKSRGDSPTCFVHPAVCHLPQQVLSRSFGCYWSLTPKPKQDYSCAFFFFWMLVLLMDQLLAVQHFFNFLYLFRVDMWLVSHVRPVYEILICQKCLKFQSWFW